MAKKIEVDDYNIPLYKKNTSPIVYFKVKLEDVDYCFGCPFLTNNPNGSYCKSGYRICKKEKRPKKCKIDTIENSPYFLLRDLK